MNSLIERWIQACRHELLDRMLIYNQAHLLRALREYEQFHNGHRPHRGLTNARPLRPLPEPITDPAKITRLRVHRRDRLGGVLHEYEHAEAHTVNLPVDVVAGGLAAHVLDHRGTAVAQDAVHLVERGPAGRSS